MFIIEKLLLRAVCVCVAKRCFCQTWFLGVRIERRPYSSRSIGNSEGLPRVRGKALNRKSGYEMEH